MVTSDKLLKTSLRLEKLQKKAKKGRKKLNFMLDNNMVIKLMTWIPSGKRSEFVNGAIDQSLTHYVRGMAIESMDKLRKKTKLRMTDKEIRKARKYGRE